MKQHRVSHVVLVVSIIGAVIIPYIVGCFIRAREYQLSSQNSAVSGRLLTTNISDKNIDSSGNTTLLTSGACQSLSVDMDQLNQQLLQSSTSIENIVSTLISETSILKANVLLRPPHCESITTTSQRLYCNVMLSNSYLSVYTWPLSGVIGIDIFACNANESIVSLLPKIKDLFGVQVDPTTNLPLKSMVRWHYKLRGDRSDDGHSAFMNGDMDQFLCSYIDFDLKESVVSVQTDFQTIDVYDTINPRFKTRDQYHASLQKDSNSYYSSHPELFRPDRIIYLDGILQSRYYGDAAYHEPLVHPALFTHPNPKRVAIIGGGEGATLREVLKHNTITTVTMIEIDELMVNVSKQYIPEWSDCSMIVGSTPSCFDDPRTEMFYTDGIAWFIDRYLDSDSIDDELLYDIIIMDALDPESSTEFSSVLYNAEDFMNAISNALRSDGMLVTQLGEEVEQDSPGFHYTSKKIEYNFMQILSSYGFDRMEDYTEAHGGFMGSWKYKILFKCAKCNYLRWHSTQANVDYEIKKRAMNCVNDCNLFKYFDGATMMGYQYASRVNEATFCRDIPQNLPDRKEFWCNNHHGYDPALDHIKINAPHKDAYFDGSNQDQGHYTKLELSSSEQGHSVEFMTTSPIATSFSYVGLDIATKNIIVPPVTTNVVRLLLHNATSKSHIDDEAIKRWNFLNSILEDFGIPCAYWGPSCYFISSLSLLSSSNVYHSTEVRNDVSWATIQEEKLPNMSSLLNTAIYNPYVSRNHLNFQWYHNIYRSIVPNIHEKSG